MNISIKGIYAGRSGSFQLIILVLLVLFGSSVATTFSFPFIMIKGYSDNPDILRVIQLISSLCMLLFPAIGAAYLFSNNVKEYLSIREMPGTKILSMVILSMLLLTPIISVTQIINQAIELPAPLLPVEKWMKEQENTMEEVTKLLLQGNGFFTLLFNILVIAVTAGITEEFLFRGSLQRILEKWFSNHHTVIWIAAFIFSAFHLQFYGLIPRMLFGAYFGYLLYWSKNIWIPVIAHFFNNLCGVIIMSNPALSENKLLSDHANLTDILPIAAISVVFFIVCLLNLKKILISKVFLP